MRLAAAACLCCFSAAAEATVEVDFTGTTHAGSTAVPVGLPISGSYTFDETAIVEGYHDATTANFTAPGSAQFTVDGQTHTYTLTSIFVNDTGQIVFDFANGSDILHIANIFTTNTNVSGFPDVSFLVGPLVFLVADFPNNAGASVEVNAEVSTTLGPVPEPATWAMMLVGFAGIGWQLRRVRRTPPALVA